MKCPDTTNNFTIPGTMFMLVLVEASREADTRQMMDSSCLAGWCIGVSGIGVSCMHIGYSIGHKVCIPTVLSGLFQLVQSPLK